MMKKVRSFAYLLSAFLLVSAPGFSLITVTSIQMDPAGIKFFDASSGTFVVEDALTGLSEIDIQQGDISTAQGAYKFDGSIVITPSDLTWSMAGVDGAAFGNTSGGVVSTMTIVATRVWKEGGSDVFSSTVTLFEADMVAPAAPGWFLSELPQNAELYTGQTNYVLTAGEFFNGSVMRMADFSVSYGLNGVSPINQSFSQDLVSMDPDIKLQAPIPEPATLLLLGFGAVMTIRKKK